MQDWSEQHGDDGAWRQQAASAADNAKSAFDAASAGVKQRARKIAERQKDAGADQIDGVARAVHGAAHEIERELPQAAGFVEDAAARLEGLAASVRQRSIDELLRGLNNFARAQPATLFGGAILAGFALSRFLKSSTEAGGERGEQN